MSIELTFTMDPGHQELTLEQQGFMGDMQIQEVQVILTELSIGLRGRPGKNGLDGTIENLELAISDDTNNRLKLGSDNKLHVEDEWSPDPLAFYLLARG
jgi:hypothetical protein